MSNNFAMNILRIVTALGMVLTFTLAPLAEEKAESDGKKANPPAEKSSIQWLSYTDALDKSRTENKHVLIHFTRKGCGWCKLMEKQTYTNPDVIKMVNDNFTPTMVWGDSRKELDIDGYRITERALATQEFGVTGYPEFWFVSPKRVKVGPLKGYLSPERFIKALEFVKEYKYDTTHTEQQENGNKKESD